MAPNPPNADEASRLTVSARIIRDIVDHLPSARAGVGGGPGKGGGKNDPQLAWIFGDNEVTVKSLEMGADAKGRCCNHLIGYMLLLNVYLCQARRS